MASSDLEKTLVGGKFVYSLPPNAAKGTDQSVFKEGNATEFNSYEMLKGSFRVSRDTSPPPRVVYGGGGQRRSCVPYVSHDRSVLPSLPPPTSVPECPSPCASLCINSQLLSE